MTSSSPLVIPRPDQLPTRRQYPRAVPTAPPLDVFAAVVSASGCAAWAVQVGADNLLSDGGPGNLEDAVAAVCRAVSDLAGRGGARVVVRVVVRTADPYLQQLANLIPAVEAYPVEFARTDSRAPAVFRTAQDRLAAALRAAPRLEVAADGSWRRGTCTAGYAFLTSDGSYRTRAEGRVPSNDVAELRAIRLALEAFAEARRLLVRSDSRVALHWLDDPHHAPPALREDAKAIWRLRQRRDVRFGWVRGHTGPGLHDGADRLAVAARRALESGLGHQAPAAQAGLIVAESLAAHGPQTARVPGRQPLTERRAALRPGAETVARAA